MEPKFEYYEVLPKGIWGGFHRRMDAETVIEYMGFIANRNGQDGPIHLSSVIFKRCSIIPGISIEHEGMKSCTLSDLTNTEFQGLCLRYPKSELQELRNLEAEYKERVIESARIKLDRELAEYKARRT